METQEARLALAEELLQEAVYRSRGAQAGAALFAAPLAAEGATGNCGLGAKAAVVLDLTPRAEEVFAALFPGGLGAAELAALRAVIADWVKRQDGLDRRRNHFLKDFRQAHGFDRRGYDAAQAAEFDAGLARVNGEAGAARRAAAVALLAAAEEPPLSR